MTRGPARFLVFRGGALGDFIVTLPVLQGLRARWPEAHIELAGYPRVADLARETGLVQKVISLDRADVAQLFAWVGQPEESWRRYLASFDVVVTFLYDPDGTVRGNLSAAGCRRVLYINPQVQEGHACDHFAQVLESLAIYDPPPWPTLTPPEAWQRSGGAILAGLGLGEDEERTVAIHPGSGSPAKNWPLDRYLLLAERLRTSRGAEILWLVGEADDDLGAELGRAGVGPVLRDAPLADVAAVLSVCRAHVGNDSGISHLAAALGLPTLALFGPTDPARWAPRGPRAGHLAAPGRDLAALPVDAVAEALNSLL